MVGQAEMMHEKSRVHVSLVDIFRNRNPIGLRPAGPWSMNCLALLVRFWQELPRIIFV
jgi:hypothetical protein